MHQAGASCPDAHHWSLQIDPLIAPGVLIATATTDAAYVMFTAPVVARRRVPAATWSSVWYLLSSFAVISTTSNWFYVFFAATGSWIGAYLTLTFVHRTPRTAVTAGSWGGVRERHTHNIIAPPCSRDGIERNLCLDRKIINVTAYNTLPCYFARISQRFLNLRPHSCHINFSFVANLRKSSLS